LHNNKIVHTLLLAVTTVLFLYFFIIGIKNVFRYNKFEIEHEILSAQFQKEVLLNNWYKQELVMMKNPSYWELLAKNRLSYVNKREHIYKIIYNGD
jgi:cell division protein FtsB